MEMESSLSFMTFKGSVTEAITEAKNQRKLFVVYISGDDADTSSLERYTLRSLNVVQFVSKYCIFLHLPAESADGLQFSAIYPQKSIPSITVVGFNGVRLWQHEGYIDPEALASSLEKARLNLRIQETTATVVTTTLASESFEVATKESESYNVNKPEKVGNESHLDGDTLVGYVDNSEDDHPGPSDVLDIHSVNDPSEPEGSAPTSIEDKMEEYERAEGVGRKTKDKSEIVTRFDKLNDVHLNIRLVNGSSLQEKFSLTSTLQMVKEYVDNNQAADFGSYDLAIPYPRKVFDNRELSKSISELGLLNRQTLVVVPHQRPASDGKRAGSSSLKRATSKNTDDSAENGVGYFAFAKRILCYANPFAYLGAAAASSSNSEQESRSRIHEHGPTTNRSSSVGRSGQALATSRSGSNIHTLKHDEDDDERFSNRNAFWNGNSTQYGGDNGEAK